jgi:TM2 domain-containing membrane protein YozV
MSDKKILPVFLLCFILGIVSAHRLYLGKYLTAILQIVTLGGLGIWLMIDLFFIITGRFEDKEGRLISEWN